MSFVSNEAFKFADRKHMEPMSLMGLFQFRSCRSFVRVDFLDLSQDLFWRQLLTQSLYQFLHRNVLAPSRSFKIDTNSYDDIFMLFVTCFGANFSPKVNTKSYIGMFWRHHDWILAGFFGGMVTHSRFQQFDTNSSPGLARGNPHL